MLTVLEYAYSKNHRAYWKCMCDCGKEVFVRGDGLKDGNNKSCGCLNYKPTLISHNMTNTKLYRIWASMRQRCTNKNTAHYNSYGGRGIRVCEQWELFEEFYIWSMSNGYVEGLSIERIDVNGNYEPSNCKWITKKEQANNTRRTILITHNDKTLNIAQWAKELNVTYDVLYGRLKKYEMNLEKVIENL